MRALALTAANQPAAVVDVPAPEVPPDGFRVAVRAASVNGIDVYQASGALAAMMEHDYPTVVGRDFAGVVEAVGPDCATAIVGDEVLGFVRSMPPLHAGSIGELVAGAEGIVLAPKPRDISFEAAAAIPLAGVTALDSVDAVALGAGDVVLIVGATGGVGSIAVQLASERGARVIATARAGDADAFVRSLGAAETVDYAAGDAADAVRELHPDGIDALIDLVSRGEAFTRMTNLVRRGGRVATTLGAADVADLGQAGITATNVMGTPTPENLAHLAGQAAAGRLRIEIREVFPLERAADAIRTFQAGTIGKLVIRVSPS